MTGTKKTANVFLAGTDRIAIDAVAVAILKDLGSTREIMEKRIFEQEQISRAVELNWGSLRRLPVEIITADRKASRTPAKSSKY